MKKLLIITLIILSSCGSVSKLQLKNNKQEIAKIDFNKYQKIIILDFSNNTKNQPYLDENKIPITQKLADKIYHGLQDSSQFANLNLIKTKSPKFNKKGNLIISGKLTRFDNGNDILRGIFGLLGRSRLEGEVDLVDGHTKKVIATINFKKSSLAYGLFIAANQDLKYLIDTTAKVIITRIEDGQI